MNEVNSEENKFAYKKQSNLVKNLVRKKRWTFCQEKLHVESTQNTRGFFNIYNELMGKSQKPEQDFFTKKTMLKSSRVLEKKFRLKLNPTIKLNYLRKTANFFFSKTIKKKIEEVLQKNRPKYCLDCYGLNYILLKKMSDPLATCLEQLFLKCIIKSYFPDALKIAKLVPLH